MNKYIAQFNVSIDGCNGYVYLIDKETERLYMFTESYIDRIGRKWSDKRRVNKNDMCVQHYGSFITFYAVDETMSGACSKAKEMALSHMKSHMEYVEQTEPEIMWLTESDKF